jgi:hypothetical protein
MPSPCSFATPAVSGSSDRGGMSGRAIAIAALFVTVFAHAGCRREPASPAAAIDPRADRIARARGFPRPIGPAGHRRYAPHRDIPATVFWVGEPSTAQNGCTPNLASAFDHDWIGAYGGCDAAAPRVTESDGFNRPASFVPRENPYYFALPYGSNDDAPFAEEVPWIADRPAATRLREAVKNRWVAVLADGRTCYAQWEDVGPFCHDDVDYVLGGAKPRNDGVTCDVGGPGNGTVSGIDLSPATAICLGHEPNGVFPVEWWFVDDADVPDGPWRRVITTSAVRDGPPKPAGPCIAAPPYPACGG